MNHTNDCKIPIGCAAGAHQLPSAADTPDPLEFRSSLAGRLSAAICAQLHTPRSRTTASHAAGNESHTGTPGQS